MEYYKKLQKLYEELKSDYGELESDYEKSQRNIRDYLDRFR